jgi:hypothetical protein
MYPHENIDNRLSQMQRAILEVLTAKGATAQRGDYIAHLPRTGDM